MRQIGENGYRKGREAGEKGTGGGNKRSGGRRFRPPCPPLTAMVVCNSKCLSMHNMQDLTCTISSSANSLQTGRWKTHSTFKDQIK